MKVNIKEIYTIWNCNLAGKAKCLSDCEKYVFNFPSLNDGTKSQGFLE